MPIPPPLASVSLITVCTILACSNNTTPGVGYGSAPRSLAVEVTVRDSITGALLSDAASGTIAAAG